MRRGFLSQVDADRILCRRSAPAAIRGDLQVHTLGSDGTASVREMARVFECARQQDRAVEIDAYPDRQDLDVELLRLAREVGVRISIGSDAHAPEQLAFLDYGIAAARAAGIEEDRILNCMTADELIAWTARPRA